MKTKLVALLIFGHNGYALVFGNGARMHDR
jgi:hypothetical protein